MSEESRVARSIGLLLAGYLMIRVVTMIPFWIDLGDPIFWDNATILVEAVYFGAATTFLVARSGWVGATIVVGVVWLPSLLFFVLDLASIGPYEIWKVITRPNDMPITWNPFYGFYRIYVGSRASSMVGVALGLGMGAMVKLVCRWGQSRT